MLKRALGTAYCALLTAKLKSALILCEKSHHDRGKETEKGESILKCYCSCSMRGYSFYEAIHYEVFELAIHSTIVFFYSNSNYEPLINENSSVRRAAISLITQHYCTTGFLSAQ